MRHSLAYLTAAAVLATALAAFAQPAAAPPEAPIAPPSFGAWGVDLAGRDTTVKPGDDFNRHASGTYLQNLVIPADRTGYGVDYVLADIAEQQQRQIMEIAGATPDSVKVADMYRAFMDERAINALGAAPLAKDLDAIRKVTTRAQLAALMGEVNDGFHGSVFGLYISPDPKRPDRYSVNLSQAGLGLPDRDYYLTDQFKEKKAKYRDYVEKVLTLAGWANPKANADAILAFETKVAKASWTRSQQRDAEKTYNPTTVATLTKSAPGFAWRPFLAKAGLSKTTKVIVNEKTSLPKIAAIYAATPVSTLKAWAAFNLADNAAPYLSEAFVDARFQFRSKELSGQPEQRPRWKRGIAAVNTTLGEAVGREYVARHFPPEAKAKIDALVNDLKVAFKARIEGLTWMSPATKTQALDKLAKFHSKIGYPDKWRDYSPLTISASDLYGNIERGIAFEWAREVARLNKPVDRNEWYMTPQTVNAYYDSQMNEIVFPAAILQAPYFAPGADAAANYGGIGAVIGHEMTHGFDDEGRKSDGDGKLRNWWTAEDAKRFEADAKRLGEQYSSYEVLPGAKINGELTMGENIADLGGILVALDAYRLSLKGQPAPVLDGLTGDQRFFLAFAQSWRGKRRDDAIRQQLVADPHSPEAYRVNGVVRNVDDWYRAFNVAPGEKLYLAPKDRARIW